MDEPRGVPLKAMGFDVGFNLLLMMLGNPIYILAASTGIHDLQHAQPHRRLPAAEGCPAAQRPYGRR